MLIGHLDTVFEPDSPFQKFERVSETQARAGHHRHGGRDVIIVQALGALQSIGALKDMHVTVVMTGDEESSGDPQELARKALVDAAKGADVAIGFEDGAGDPRTAVIGRRGTTAWTLKVTGKPAHSSQIFRQDIGYGAIFEAVRILNAFREQLAGEAHLTFNPALAVGGTQVQLDVAQARGSAFGKDNVIPEHAIVSGDLRALQKRFERAPEWKQSCAPRHCRIRARRSRSTKATRRSRQPTATGRCWRNAIAEPRRRCQAGGGGHPDRAGAATCRSGRHVPMILDGVGLMGTAGTHGDGRSHRAAV